MARRSISPAELKARLRQPGELAILDVREEAAHHAAKPFYAAFAPLSRLEILIRDLVPRRATPLVLLDDGNGLAERAADVLDAMGYSDLAVLDGGVPAWQAAGYELFSGVHVPSKAFGEVVEQQCGTPHIEAGDLKAMMDSGKPLVVLDSRPIEEFRNMSIPGGVDAPGAELAYRVHDMAPDPSVPVVVNCAGRTRSIIGAQSLINAGIPNPVFALKDGTMGWTLAGFDLDHGRDVMAPDPSAEGLARAQACAAEVARRYGVRSLSLAGLDRLRRESADHSLYVLDVRSPAEYEAGHLPGAASAPGGQLVQETERWIATLGARVVLVDDTGVRATMTASWLLQMGWEEVFVLEGGIVGRTLTRGAWKPNLAGLQLDPRPPLRVEELRAMIDRDEALVIDLATSQDYIKGHIPGAWFAIRAELDEAVTRMPGTDVYVLTSPDNVLARLAAESLRQLTRKSVLTLEGGTRGWVAAGGALASGPERMASEARDVALKPYHHPDEIAQRMRDYLVWEVGLVAQIARDGDHRFRVGPLQNTAASVAEA